MIEILRLIKITNSFGTLKKNIIYGQIFTFFVSQTEFLSSLENKCNKTTKLFVF